MTVHYQWRPIQPVELESEQYDFSEITSLHQQWLIIKGEREGSTPQAFQAFLDRLRRSWAIETGIIEGLYTLDRGVTQTLIEKGIVAEYIERSSTNKDPDDLVRMLDDHLQAIDLVYKYIQVGNPLTRSFVRQLHSTFTANQNTYRPVNQFGVGFDAALDRGAFKKLPNNPTRPDGTLHEYCPSEQVDSELDNLLYFYNECQKDQDTYHPLLTGAWLHHRFTQIHPFQDGNGRVARALLTWHLVKEDFLPIVVSRDDRSRYIGALESGDRGDLIPLIELLVQFEKQTILSALGEPEPVSQPAQFDQVLDHIVEQIKRQSIDRETQMRSVNSIAELLRDAAETNLSTEAGKIEHRLLEAGMQMFPRLDKGGPEDDREHWYAREVIETANDAKHWVNRNESRFFVRLSLNPQVILGKPRHPKLVFVVSLHHTGQQLTGIMAATAFARIEYYRGDNSDSPEESGEPHFRNCTVNPFTFTWENEAATISPRFSKWTEECLTIALRYWSEFLR